MTWCTWKRGRIILGLRRARDLPRPISNGRGRICLSLHIDFTTDAAKESLQQPERQPHAGSGCRGSLRRP